MSLLVFLIAAVASPARCAPVSLAVGNETPALLTGKRLGEITANFEKAYEQACAEGLLAKKPLVTAKTKRLFLWNAPNANIASIYANEGRMLLEYPFVTDGREVRVPSVDELHEAIYCAVHGASVREQEESGRCLPD